MKLGNGKYALALTGMLLGFSFQSQAQETEVKAETNYQSQQAGVIAPTNSRSNHWHRDRYDNKRRAARKIRRAKMGFQDMQLHREFSFSGMYTERTFRRSMRRLDRIADMLRGHSSPWSQADYNLFFSDDETDSVARRDERRRPGHGKPGHGKPGHGVPGNGGNYHGNAKELLQHTIEDLRRMGRGGEIRFHEQYARQNWRANMSHLREARELINGNSGHPGHGDNFRYQAETYLQRYLGYNAQSAINALPHRLDRSDYHFVEAIGSSGNVYTIANGLRAYFTNHRAGSSYDQYKHEAGKHILRSLQDWNRDQCLATLPAKVSRYQADEVQRILYRFPSFRVAQALRNYFQYGSWDRPWSYQQ